MSPGIQALRSLWEILERGWFILCASPSSGAGSKGLAFALSLELPGGACGDDVSGSAIATILDQEKLLGLRARLSIMEVPEAMERDWLKSCGYGARVVATALSNQLQVCGRSPRHGCLWNLTVERFLPSTGGQRQNLM